MGLLEIILHNRRPNGHRIVKPREHITDSQKKFIKNVTSEVNKAIIGKEDDNR